ncbi:DoxX family protein [Paenibacillus urinalis]|uniref:DoxX family protein n=1 Tax=Paenibacillus urinalis TaxID=521520 RepID=A0AAX3MZG0_9BACL|nr:DoxX family protein [Paenibacillus urinalis]WDH82985.1 DoxX family protein [Paenibacillus urinalis]
MIPFYALIVSFIVLRCLGWAGWEYFDSWQPALQAASGIMLLLAASAHWGSKRGDLVRMVPSWVPQPEWVVTVTGLLEIAGAIGLVIPALSTLAAVCLVVLLVAMFPANMKAANERLTIGGRPVPTLPVRTMLQLVFIAAILLSAPGIV